MTGLRFLFRVTLRQLDLAAEIYHLRESQKIPQVMSPDETRRVLAQAQASTPTAVLQPHQAQNPRQNPHSARSTAATHFPRFRALAPFGRRPPQRVVRPSSRRPKTCT
jgi:hypothetical protein